MSQLGLQKY
jgi:hypothetical protein